MAIDASVPSVCVREGDWPLFLGMGQRERLRVLALERICKAIDVAGNRREAMRAAAAAHGGDRGLSEGTIRSAYYAWLANNRNVLSLCRRNSVSRNTIARRLADHYKGYCERNQRSSRAAYDQMLRDIRSGQSVPGLGDWRALWDASHGTPAPDACPADFVPSGLTYRNLQRVAGLSRYEQIASRIGQKAAFNHAPSVYSTRVGLEVGQAYMWDDLTHDVLCDVGNNVRAMRPQEFACLDVASAYKAAWGIKAEILREDGTRERLREREMRYLVAHVLVNVGYRAAGSTWFVEHGTAAIRDELRRIIRSLTRDAISFVTSGITGAQVHGGLWPGKGEGVPGLKAHLESSFNFVHNVAGSLPAQTGSNSRLTKPEQVSGIERYCTDLMRAAADLPDETKRTLMLPVLRLSEFSDAIASLYRIIHDRREHALEGWEQAGNVEHCFRLAPSMPWAPIRKTLEAIEDPAKRAAMETAIVTLAERRMVSASPGEVWRRGAAKLTRLDHWATVPILADDERCRRSGRLSRKGELAFSDAYYGPGVHRFWPVLHTPDGRRELVRDHRDFSLILTPYDSARLYVCDPASMACLGYCERMVPGSRVDIETMAPLMGRRQEIIGMLNEPIAARHADDAAAREAMLAHNERVLAGARAGLPGAEEAARIAAEPADAGEILGGADPAEERLEPAAATAAEPADISELL
jgi:hypothetical protein